MKKISIALIIVIIVSVATPFLYPEVLSNTPFKQKALIKTDKNKVARFYFKKKQTARDSIYMKGVICSNTLKDIKQTIQQNPQITTLVMENVSGSIDNDINILASLEIKKHNINTYIPKNGIVTSGGTNMFLAGKKRDIHPTAKIGIHSWISKDSMALYFPENHQKHKKYLDYYSKINIQTEFYWYTMKAAPADSIYWMTANEIEKYGIITNSGMETPELLEIQKQISSNEYSGRGVGNNHKTQHFIRSYFKTLNLKKIDRDYDFPFTFILKKPRTGTNLVGYIKGKTNPEKYIVIGAHYDHLGIINDTIYNGADDNASGTAALLVLAKHFSKNPPVHSIIFAAFDAEECGLFGSKHFVDNPPVLLSNIILNINMDMISRNPNNEIYVVGTHPYPQFKPFIEELAKDSPLTVLYGHDNPKDKTKDYWMNSSDNGPFFKKGIPNITFSEEDHPDYHKATDDFEKINPEFYKNVVLLIQQSIEKIDQNFPVTK